ncbi:hypothetical protein GJ689_10125 [Rhodoplanes serenus]|uniref:EF-hand domain-containing protein n=1 Tax=Rhodoplanes serenus TaxID=200615 RepID=A0A9X5ASP9_9BRAD|nr:EF-hand domain-containing protein [Rhodoplanes serenus]MTW16564.1 hypothetical protein [Rhodoplanes serenus]
MSRPMSRHTLTLPLLLLLASTTLTMAQSGGGARPGDSRGDTGLPGVFERSPADLRTQTRPGEDPVRQSAPAWDANRDGVFTCEEWKQYAGRLFAAADRNRDGQLDAGEFEALRRSDPALGRAELGYFDDNRDGRVARAEFVERKSPLFARFDRNGDCRVTAEEMQGKGDGGMRPSFTPGGGVGGAVRF